MMIDHLNGRPCRPRLSATTSCLVAAVMGLAVASGVAEEKPANASRGPLAIRVQGPQLVDADGHPVQLRGVNVSGLEFVAVGGWNPANPWGDTPNWSAIKAWHANAVRIPLNESSWLGQECIDAAGSRGKAGAMINPDPGGNYRETVKSSVADATAAGFYVILDLHLTAPGKYCAEKQNPMADADHSIAFWSQVATTFKARPNVIFEPFNEPFTDQTPIGDGSGPWDILREGGPLTKFIPGGSVPSVDVHWMAAGMQSMVDAIRATDAHNVILTSGTAYGQQLDRWLGNKPDDPLKQLGAVWHAYPTFGSTFGSGAYAQPNFAPRIYEAVQGIQEAGYPVVITEYGDHNVPGTRGAPFAANLLPWADAHGIGYFGWAWAVWQNPDDVLIKDATGTPSDGYGVYVKAHYQCMANASPICP